MKFEFIEHTADVKFRAYGKSLNEAFGNSALAMFASMYSGKVKEVSKKKISVSGKDLESLLYALLRVWIVSFYFGFSCKFFANWRTNTFYS